MNIYHNSSSELLPFYTFTYFGSKCFHGPHMEEKCLKKIPKDQFEKTKIIASNQGLYNDFLEAVLIRSL